jgi:hypothetical protein
MKRERSFTRGSLCGMFSANDPLFRHPQAWWIQRLGVNEGTVDRQVYGVAEVVC